MTPAAAASNPPDSRLDSIAAWLRAHEWVQDARLTAAPPNTSGDTEPASAVAFLVPSRAGIAALRRKGKQRLVDEWERYLKRAGLGRISVVDWRLADTLPIAGREGETITAAAASAPVISDLVLPQGSRSASCRVFIPYDLQIFRGHFPSAPIVPGVVQIGWAVELARACRLVTGQFTGIASAKFRRLVQPGMSLELCLGHDPGKKQLCFEYSLDTAVVSTGRVLFRDAHD